MNLPVTWRDLITLKVLFSLLLPSFLTIWQRNSEGDGINSEEAKRSRL
ncbi:hypothetical protein [Paenibacillus taichungensis]